MGNEDQCASTADDAQLQAALRARAKMERLLAAPTPFANDYGNADPDVLAALENTGLPRCDYLDQLWSVLSTSRLIVPCVAHASPVGTGLEKLEKNNAPDLSANSVATAGQTNEVLETAASLAVKLDDGHIALPVFTSAAAMLAWRQDVRPVPVEPIRAAQVALACTDQLWILDPGSRNLRLPRPAVVALAGGQAWVPSWRNQPVQDEISAQLCAIDNVLQVAFAPGQNAELRVFIRLDVTKGMAAAAAALEACQYVMVNPAWGELIDTVELCPIAA